MKKQPKKKDEKIIKIEDKIFEDEEDSILDLSMIKKTDDNDFSFDL